MALLTVIIFGFIALQNVLGQFQQSFYPVQRRDFGYNTYPRYDGPVIIQEPPRSLDNFNFPYFSNPKVFRKELEQVKKRQDSLYKLIKCLSSKSNCEENFKNVDDLFAEEEKLLMTTPSSVSGIYNGIVGFFTNKNSEKITTEQSKTAGTSTQKDEVTAQPTFQTETYIIS